MLSLTGKLPPNLSDVDTRLFVGTALGYLVFAIGAMFLVEQRGLTYRLQVYGGVLADVGATSLLMHAAGGVTSGIGILLVMSVAGACLLASGRAAVFFAALASMALLGETFFGTLYDGYSPANYTQAGLLGAACFGTAVLASALAERARRSEALAAARALDIEHLSRLNEHIVRRMRAGIMVLDREGAVVLANDAAAEILGRESGTMRGALAAISSPLERVLSQLAAQRRESGRRPSSAMAASTRWCRSPNSAPVSLSRTARWCFWRTPLKPASARSS